MLRQSFVRGVANDSGDKYAPLIRCCKAPENRSRQVIDLIDRMLVR